MIESQMHILNLFFCLPACDCNVIGSVDNYCEVYTGQCRCKFNYGSRNCSECANGYFNFPDCACKLRFRMYLKVTGRYCFKALLQDFQMNNHICRNDLDLFSSNFILLV